MWLCLSSERTRSLIRMLRGKTVLSIHALYLILFYFIDHYSRIYGRWTCIHYHFSRPLVRYSIRLPENATGSSTRCISSGCRLQADGWCIDCQLLSLWVAAGVSQESGIGSFPVQISTIELFGLRPWRSLIDGSFFYDNERRLHNNKKTDRVESQIV